MSGDVVHDRPDWNLDCLRGKKPILNTNAIHARQRLLQKMNLRRMVRWQLAGALLTSNQCCRFGGSIEPL